MTLSEQITLMEGLIRDEPDIRIVDYWKELGMRERVERREPVKKEQYEIRRQTN